MTKKLIFLFLSLLPLPAVAQPPTSLFQTSQY